MSVHGFPKETLPTSLLQVSYGMSVLEILSTFRQDYAIIEEAYVCSFLFKNLL